MHLFLISECFIRKLHRALIFLSCQQVISLNAEWPPSSFPPNDKSQPLPSTELLLLILLFEVVIPKTGTRTVPCLKKST
jgi:hypothetical protein